MFKISSTERWLKSITLRPALASSRAMSACRSEKPITRSGLSWRILSVLAVRNADTFGFSRLACGGRTGTDPQTPRTPPARVPRTARPAPPTEVERAHQRPVRLEGRSNPKDRPPGHQSETNGRGARARGDPRRVRPGRQNAGRRGVP